MKHSYRLLRCALWMAASCVPLWSAAVPVEVGTAWQPLTLKDQHEQPVVVGPSTRKVIFAAEKSVSDLVVGVLGTQGKTTLARAGAVYVADISAMPAIVSRLFALPKLRELPFVIALAHEAAAVADLPRRAGAATVLTLDRGQVIQVQYLQTEVQLRQTLDLTP
jgi:NADPH-dependent ferric siderophore reductase